MDFKDCNWCGYIYPVTPGQRTCPYCGCKNTDQPPKKIEVGKDKKPSQAN